MSGVDGAWSSVVSLLRAGRGGRVQHGGARRRPEQPPVLYEFEACPYCRKVREGLSELDLDWVCRPSARGSRHRDEVPDFGDRKFFPYLVDPNTGVRMKESEDILDYLHETYGAGRPHIARRVAPLDTLTASLASAVRPRGRRVRVQRASDPAELLELYQYEACPACRRVRERLHELDLPFLVRTVAHGSAGRPRLRQLGGEMRVPFLVDPNTGESMYESTTILAYLDDLYG